MLRLAKLAAVLAALWAAWAFVPVHGRTLADRWRAAPTAGAFAGSAWRELSGGGDHPPAPGPRARQGDRRPARDARPAESHSDADRRAVDRILSDHLH
ncbi:MAG TPA: hypothetical protein VLU43_16730 [Anaeromyxobacteraceae bacterium]|nr:hypothetical protein [Anaeromyxobacteraceae bacterium]